MSKKIPINTLAGACFTIVEAYKTDSDFREAFIVSIEAAYRDALRESDSFIRDRELATEIAERLLDVQNN